MATNTSQPTEETFTTNDNHDDVAPLVRIATAAVDVEQFDSADGFDNWSATTRLVQRHLERIAEGQA